MLLQLPGIFLLPLQKPKPLQQRGLEPQGEDAVSAVRHRGSQDGFSERRKPLPAQLSPSLNPFYPLIRVTIWAHPG